jgi:mycofactocin system glycosyltransferase
VTLPLPPDFRVVFDPSVRSYYDARLLVGGTPACALRLTDMGHQALEALRRGEQSESARRLARRLVDAGMAHPRPPRTSGLSAAVVVPVRDRAALLDRCLGALGGTVPVVVVDDGSRDPGTTSAVCTKHGAKLIRLSGGQGPAAARNAGHASVDTDLVAFVDSDCVVEAGWLDRLMDEFADPLVGAVAPRVIPVSPAGATNTLAYFALARCPLDLGSEEGLVGPGLRIPYVPTAALVVRRSVMERPFDPRLSHGEDVDLVWRLHASGWRVRYVPDVTVGHTEPSTWRGVLRRRFSYGKSAAPLSQRHPRKLSHLVLQPWSTTAAVLALSRRPRSALAVMALHAATLYSRFGATGFTPTRSVYAVADGFARTIVGIGRAGTMFAAPALIGALGSRATRQAALALLGAAPLEEWLRKRPPLDPVRWTAAVLADDIAYGAGVLHGCATERTLAPLLPVAERGSSGRQRDRTPSAAAYPSAPSGRVGA